MGIGGDHIHIDFRIGERKLCEIGRKESPSEGWWNTDSDPTARHIVEAIDTSLDIQRLPFHLLGMFQQQLAGRGQLQALTRPLEHPGFDFIFEALDGTAHGGVPIVQGFGGGVLRRLPLDIMPKTKLFATLRPSLGIPSRADAVLAVVRIAAEGGDLRLGGSEGTPVSLDELPYAFE